MLLATVAYLNQLLMLLVYASVLSVCLQYAAKNVVEEKEEEAKRLQQLQAKKGKETTSNKVQVSAKHYSCH